MSRPRSIDWSTRVGVFLCYRLLGHKVNPTANRYKIARSTVSMIVREFEEMGFPRRPRAAVSEALLKEMQGQHIQEVWRWFGASPGSQRVALPTDPSVGVLNLKAAMGEEEARKLAESDPLPFKKELEWHLKGTAVGQVVEEARKAARDLRKREYETWRHLRLALEAACKMSEREGMTNSDKEPHLLPALKHRIRASFSDGTFQSKAPPRDWLKWDVAHDDRMVLTLNGEPMAIGSLEDHRRVKAGVGAFLDNSFRDSRRSFEEVESLRRDVGLIQQILGREFGAIDEKEFRTGVCPACPYPEATLDLPPSTGGTKRSKKEGSHHDE